MNESTEDGSGQPSHNSGSSHLDSTEQRKRTAVGTAGDGDSNKKIKFNTAIAAPKGQYMRLKCQQRFGSDKGTCIICSTVLGHFSPVF